MEKALNILVLAGKNVDGARIAELLEDEAFELARFESVSRGVRRLERTRADVVILVPDEHDATWKRAALRIREEYRSWAIALVPDTVDTEAEWDISATFDIFNFHSVGPKCLAHSLTHLRRYAALVEAERKGQASFDWIEEVGRLGVWEMDARGKTSWSGGTRRILGDDGRLTDRFESLRQFVHPEDQEIYDQANKATFEQGWPLDFEYRVRNGDDSVRYLHVHRRVEHDANGNLARAYGMLRDVTPEREFENYLFKRDAILQVVGAFADRFLRDPDWESGMDKALERLGTATDVTRVFVLHKQKGQDEDAFLSMVYEWAAPSVTPLIHDPKVQNQPFSPTYDRWRATLMRRKVIAGHVRNFQSEERKFFEQTGTKSILFVPVFVGDQWWGMIGLSEHREEREWLPVEIESMSMVANMFGSAILRSSMEDELKVAKTMALEASKTKSRFLANMSHEIRTPISGILGMAEMTITTGLTAEQRENMDMIRDAARSLLAIINDILDISKIEADKLELKPEDYEFRKELETVVRPFGPEADRKGVVFQYAVDDDVPTDVHGDPDRLGQVLRNLISNAMKFTERGLIELNVGVAERTADKVCLEFSVRDTGEGIAEESLATIFESFTQADSSTHKTHQGTGLGLTICRELVEMMGGEIGVTSKLGRGSTFTFTAWFGVPGTTVKKQLAPQSAVPEGLHLNILLAEDNPLNQKFLIHFLSIFGHTVTVANNGLEALGELAKRGREVDLVLMDIQMPEMGGMEATSAIRQSDGKNYDPNIPIIALTAYAMKGDKERMIKAGMDDYVSKPVDMKELSAAIARSIAGREKETVRTPPASRTVRDKVSGDGVTIRLDMDSLIDRFDGNMELLGEILQLFLSEADQKLEKLDTSLKSEDANELGRALHSITNIASHVLAMDIVQQSRKLERMCYHGSIDEVVDGVMELRPQFAALIRAVRERTETL